MTTKTGNVPEYIEKLKPGCWIPEIQIRHPSKPYGAFYEALLV